MITLWKNNKLYTGLFVIVCIVLVILVILYIKWTKSPEQFQDLPVSEMHMQYAPFIFAGYHEIYDYIISSTLIKHVNNQIQLTSKPVDNMSTTDVIAFASIPRIYVYISQNMPDKVNLVFTKLKKSNNLIQLYNKQITGRELPDADINKSVDVGSADALNSTGEQTRNSITDEQYDTVMKLVKKYSFNSVSLDFDSYLPDIRLYIQYMLSTNPGFMYNIVLTDAELEKLGTTRENVTPPNAGISMTLNQGIAKFITGSGTNTSTNEALFTTLLNNKEVIPVIDDTVRETLMKESTQSMERSIQAYLFKNKIMATNIGMDRLALFKMSIINPYQTNIFYILKDSLASGTQDELSNKELESKFSKMFTPDLSPEKLAKYAAMYKASNSNSEKQKTNNSMIINPDLECFVLINKFQLLRVVLKRKESELNL
jgi:hypothetical protein